MKGIKVHLQYPWKFPDSPYYQYLIQSPPSGVIYQNIEKTKGVITSRRFFWMSNFFKRNIRRFTRIFNLTIPNAHPSPSGDYDIIHCAHCLSKDRDSPWVADIEMISSLSIAGGDTKYGREKIREILLRDNCKKIIPWAKSVRDDLLKIYPEIEDKIEVVYPAIPEVKNLKKPDNKRVRIIFIARYFYIKGGLIALEVMERLRRKYNIEGIVVSSVPNKLKRRYPHLEIKDLMTQKELFRLMGQMDLFLYPSGVDTFGFSILEAMAFGLPILTINTEHTRSRNEIVKNGRTGFSFDIDTTINYRTITNVEEGIIRKIMRNGERLILDSKLRKRMSKNCLEEIKKGKFSIGERNKKLKRIYYDAIK